MKPLAPIDAFSAAALGQLRPGTPVGQAFQPPAAQPGGNILAMLSQVAPMGGVASPMQMHGAQQNLREARQSGDGVRDARQQYRALQAGPQLPNPMAIAKDHVSAARQQFKPLQREFRSLDPAGRKAMRPELQEARGHLGMMRDWYQGLKALPYGEAVGTASMGPPRPSAGPQMMPMMAMPQFPGLPPVNSIGELVQLMQHRTADRMGTGGDRNGGGDGSGSLLPITDERTATPEQLAEYYRRLEEERRQRELAGEREFGGGRG